MSKSAGGGALSSSHSLTHLAYYSSHSLTPGKEKANLSHSRHAEGLHGLREGGGGGVRLH